MKTVVFTLMWGTAWERYGKKFMAGFERNWPSNVELVVYSDIKRKLDRGTCVTFKELPSIEQFRARWREEKAASGHVTAGVKVKSNNGYSFRHDAIKWMPQAVVPQHALQFVQDGDYLCWMDGDCITHKPVPDGWVKHLLRGHDAVVPQRPGTHSEIGLWAVHVGPKTKQAINNFASFYRTDEVFSLNEWHSAYVWDRAFELVPDLKIRNVNTENRRGHVWPHTELAEYTMHYKGKRKDKA